jgi:hypothetical protein
LNKHRQGRHRNGGGHRQLADCPTHIHGGSIAE